jgi:hypothetical protein
MTFQFERVTYRPEGQRSRTVTLKVTGDTEQFVTGIQVDRDGAPVQPSAAYLRQHGAVDGNVQHIIEKVLITKRVRLVEDYRHGGGLVEDK